MKDEGMGVRAVILFREEHGLFDTTDPTTHCVCIPTHNHLCLHTTLTTPAHDTSSHQLTIPPHTSSRYHLTIPPHPTPHLPRIKAEETTALAGIRDEVPVLPLCACNTSRVSCWHMATALQARCLSRERLVEAVVAAVAHCTGVLEHPSCACRARRECVVVVKRGGASRAPGTVGAVPKYVREAAHFTREESITRYLVDEIQRIYVDGIQRIHDVSEAKQVGKRMMWNSDYGYADYTWSR
jgi:hypothetical protein